jgi:hypothetical protein
MPRGYAQSSTAVIMPPDWLTKAISRGVGDVGEAGIQADPGHHHSHVVWPDESQQLGLRGSEHLLLKLTALLSKFSEAG